MRGPEPETKRKTDERTENGLADPAGRITAVAGALLVAALAVALADGGDRCRSRCSARASCSRCSCSSRAPWRGIGRHPALLVGAAVAAVPFALSSSSAPSPTAAPSGRAGPARRLAPVIIALAALGGADPDRRRPAHRFGLAQRGLTPWQRLTGTASADAARPGGSLADLHWWAWPSSSASAHRCQWQRGPLSLALLLVLGGGAAAIIAVPLLIAGLARSDRARSTTAREDERRRVAAHLHDSVLQTLALVQRQAHDPAAVARLARRQEHELRAWMAGEVELGTETLGAALREAVAEVEDDHDAMVELTILGERVLDRETEALAAAAREALRNAAHPPGAPIFVFAQASPDGAEVFVRDEGPGFDPTRCRPSAAACAIRSSGRMAAVGGSAEIDSLPGEGTEVALRIGVRDEARRRRRPPPVPRRRERRARAPTTTSWARRRRRPRRWP